MPAAIPLIRGFALLPTLHWLASEGVSVEGALAEVDLSLSPITYPFRPIPLAHAAALLRNAARELLFTSKVSADGRRGTDGRIWSNEYRLA